MCGSEPVLASKIIDHLSFVHLSNKLRQLKPLEGSKTAQHQLFLAEVILSGGCVDHNIVTLGRVRMGLTASNDVICRIVM